ncbi:MAG: hypothetical protein J5I93_00925 [Pirellulaceae bacterium]|nr:hypothetical protein [Pirellulaceae bacterium]
MRNVPSLETVERDYSSRGVKFYYIYKALAHPEHNGYVPPVTLAERLMHVAEARRQLGSRIAWLCDSIDNRLKHALGDAPNSEFLIGPDGKLLVARRWSDPEALRRDLAERLGEVEPRTTIADVGMKPLEPPRTAPRGIVPRLQLPSRMLPVQVRPVALQALEPPALADAEPFYVKLRAEVSAPYMESGSGQLYLGFFLDPLYKVHWNNRAAPLEFEAEAPESIELTPASGQGPDVRQDADADPREFLLKVSGRSEQPLRLTVKYFACDDAETFCKPVVQHYEITLRPDRDGGARRPGGMPAGRVAGGRTATEPSGGNTAGAERQTAEDLDGESSRRLRRALDFFRQFDTDRNGVLERYEWAASGRPLARADADSDGQVTLRELLDRLKQGTR